MRVVVDAFGSDHAPGPEAAGALRAVRAPRNGLEHPLEVILVGDIARLDAALDSLGRAYVGRMGEGAGGDVISHLCSFAETK